MFRHMPNPQVHSYVCATMVNLIRVSPQKRNRGGGKVGWLLARVRMVGGEKQQLQNLLLVMLKGKWERGRARRHRFPAEVLCGGGGLSAVVQHNTHNILGRRPRSIYHGHRPHLSPLRQKRVGWFGGCGKKACGEGGGKKKKLHSRKKVAWRENLEREKSKSETD